MTLLGLVLLLLVVDTRRGETTIARAQNMQICRNTSETLLADIP